MNTIKIYFLSICACVFYACSSPKTLATHKVDVTISDTTSANDLSGPHFTKYELENHIINTIDTTDVLKSGFTGLVIYDLDAKELVCNYNADKYFVAASNTKLFTLYTCLKTLKDSIPALRYLETDSTFTFWGTADPTLMHPYFADGKVIDFLLSKSATKKIILANTENILPQYGPGWMWDDYSDYYQPEITAFPLYGNILWVSQDSFKTCYQPTYLLRDTSMCEDLKYIKRDLDKNHFTFPNRLSSTIYFDQEVPYKNASKLNPILLENILQKPVIEKKLPLSTDALTILSWPIDTVLRRMMQVSDNMLAEHLLLSAGMVATDTLSLPHTIKWVKSQLLNDIPQRPIWVDGSGLSRYNRFTPSSILYLLKKMYEEEQESRLFSLMAVGGNNGTLQSLYTNDNGPFVFAKTGSMTGVYNLSGYLITVKGKKLAFSFMNNNFEGSVSSVKKAVENILMKIRLNY